MFTMSLRQIFLCVSFVLQMSELIALLTPCLNVRLVHIEKGYVQWFGRDKKLTRRELQHLVANSVVDKRTLDCVVSPDTLFILPSFALFPLKIPKNGTIPNTLAIQELLYPTFYADNRLIFDHLPSSCDEAFARQKEPRSGVYALHMTELGLSPFHAYCREDPLGGGPWTVIHRRMSGDIDFVRTYDEYKHGFGAPDENYFMGLERIHTLTTFGGPQEMWVQLTDADEYDSFGNYERFAIGSDGSGYGLTVMGSFLGSAGDSLYYHYGQKFSTYDSDYNNCANTNRGAWWYRQCFRSNLNGIYGELNDSGVIWRSARADEITLDYVHMAIRPVS